MSRQQIRKAHRERLKRGQLALQTGLSDRPTPAALSDVAAVLDEAMRADAGERRASSTVALAHALNEASLKARSGRQPLACAAGCAACCYTWVAAAAPEVFRLADAVRARGDKATLTARIRQRAEQTADKSLAERFGAKLPCPVLADDGRCGLYDARPLACRQVTSFNLAPCLDEFEGRDFGGDIAVSRLHLDHARNAFVALAIALRANGFAHTRFELSAALVRALDMPDGEARWLAGEDVFAGVATAPPDDAETTAQIDALARSLREAGAPG